MNRFQTLEVVGASVLVRRAGKPEEIHTFPSVEEAQGRAKIVTEGLDWIGTPFVDCADVKGPKGAVDCAMLCTRVMVDTGRLAPFDPRPYSPDQMRHSSEELCLKWIVEKLGGQECDKPRLGDIVIWLFGQSFSHFGILINNAEIVHAYKRARITMISSLDADILRYISTHTGRIARPVKYFDVWSR